MEINILTNMAAQWSMGEPFRTEYANFYSQPDSSLHVITVPKTCPQSCSNAMDNKGTVTIKDGRGTVCDKRQEFHKKQVNNQERFYPPSLNYTNNPSFLNGF